MKPATLILALTFVAASASAQIVPVRFSAPVNPVMNLPKLLPSPMTGPLAGMDIHLPSLVPTLTPSPALLAAAAPAPVLPVSLPGRRAPMALPTSPSRENAINPLRRIMPGVTVRFADRSKDETTAPAPAPVKDSLDQLFDGDGAGVKPGDRGVIGSERRISLPEDDLMRELGF